jgi:hypothetical protein
MKTFSLLLAFMIFSLIHPCCLTGQGLEYGDAPEGAVAYPATGVIGAFPTCKTLGTAYVEHNNFGAQLGPAFDFEGDGNAGFCPVFPPYDSDECYADGDAGLMFPEPFTIVNGVVVTCPNSSGTSLGNPCTVATWGVNIDIDVMNFMPNQTQGFMNVVIDFDQNGSWGDMVSCPGGMVPEHVLQNFIIPWGYAGPLSGLMPSGFTIGPNAGYVWARFTISEQAVFQNWDGHGLFEDGESEDYLLYIAPLLQSDFGDAPDGVLAYPSTGMNGSFPTCSSNPATGYIEHFHTGVDLGPAVDYEPDGNAGLCPSFAPYDDDECFNDGDAGLLFPEPFTIVGGQVVPCPGSAGTGLGFPCDTAVWGSNVDIDVNNFIPTQADAYMNVLIDWNKNGLWGDTVYCSDVMVPEHVLQNFPVPSGHSGALSGLMPPDFIIGPDPGYFWSRFTISDYMVNVPWDGSGIFEDGETEDYLIRVDTASVTWEYDYGDAPDGVMAYPAGGVIGNFPTCVNVSTSGFVSHTNFGAILGPAVDFENEGNAGLCPAFTPYDNDECFNDGDAGLLFPDPYTIQGGTVVPCPGSAGTALGNTCTQAVWGTHIDIHVQNFMPGQAPGYFNVLFDWTMNGAWGDVASCPTAAAPEHVVQNYIIPNGYSGPLSGLMPPAFLIGPNSGYVWARFTISEAPVPVNWDGQGSFEDGETEDYLILIGAQAIDADYGDAPEGSMAYPASGVIGAFPVCTGTGPANHYVSHLGELIFFGPLKDFETDGNAGLCSPFVMPYDNDECFADGDAGLILPVPYTITQSGGVYQVVPCTGNGGILDTICSMVHWGSELDIDVKNLSNYAAVANVLMDFNQNGRWDLDTTMHCSGNAVYEHVLVNFPVPAGYSGPLSGLNPPAFLAGPNVGYIWTRFTVSVQSVSQDWDGVGTFEEGESEDYLLYVDVIPGMGEGAGKDYDHELQLFPNPAVNSCTVSFRMNTQSDAIISIYDLRGRIVRSMEAAQLPAGKHSVVWDLKNGEGHTAINGIYFVKLTIAGMPAGYARLLISR